MKIKRFIQCLTCLLLVCAPCFAQNLNPTDELYLADPNPRFHGEQVIALQKFLLFYGCYLGPDGIDGWFGRDTESALLEYQKKNGLAETGRIKIEDIETLLDWRPDVFSDRVVADPSDYLPSETNRIISLTELDENLEVNNYYGSLSIATTDGSYEFTDFLTSPSGRFVAACSFHPENSLEFLGTGLKVWDLISGDTNTFYPYEAFLNEEYWGLREGYTFPRMTEYYWTDDEQLVMIVEVNRRGEEVFGFVVLEALAQTY